MQWKLKHDEVMLGEGSEILSKSSIILECNGVTVEVATTDKPENHIFGSKRILVDSANKLEDLARQMKKRADSLK